MTSLEKFLRQWFHGSETLPWADDWGRRMNSKMRNTMKRPEEEQDIQGFFHAMIEKDLEIPVPDFPKFKKTRTINWWIPTGIAASLALGFFLFGEKETAVTPPIGDIVIITLEEGPNQEMQFNIEHTNEMDIWESPTASLLTEY